MKLAVYYLIYIALFVVVGTTACKKLVDVGSPDFMIGRDKIFINDDSAKAARAGMYTAMVLGQGLTNGYFSIPAGLFTDELTYLPQAIKTVDSLFLTNKLKAQNSTLESMWSGAYATIYQANVILEGLSDAEGVSHTLRQEMIGEAKFVRAMHYFYMVNVWGAVPLVLSTGFDVDKAMPRTPVSVVYAQVLTDLKAADTLLPALRNAAGDEIPANIRATKWAARALLARTYLYMGNWREAVNMASSVINEGPFILHSQPSQVFLKNSPETIFQLQPVTDDYNSTEGSLLIPPVGTQPVYVITPSLLKDIEPHDLRKSAWLLPYVEGRDTMAQPFKYKVRSDSLLKECTVVLRLAELLLISAEAKVRLGQWHGPAGALADLNRIRARAGLDPLPQLQSEKELMAAVEQERQVEFMVEWGHRFFDLKRWPGLQDPLHSRLQEVMKQYKPDTWKEHLERWPIPAKQRELNAQLQQNPGY